MKTLLKIALPLAVVAIGLAVRSWLMGHAPEQPESTSTADALSVEVATARLGTHRIWVTAHGEIRSERVTALAAEVGGRVTWIASGLDEGAHFQAGQALLRIDPTDAEQALAAARAERARAAAALSIETAGAVSARADWETFGTGEATPLALHEPQVALAVAALEAADARVAQAETALTRCEILAPFDGRCVVRHAVPGAVVTPGASLARLESTEDVEARVVLRLADLITLGIPLDGTVTPLPAILDPGFGNGAEWPAQLVRIEATVDPRDRTVGAVFQVSAGSEGAGAPLSGLFVRARIQGPELADVVLLPRSARQVDGRVWIVDAENRLRLATALVVAEIEESLLMRGITEGARICLTPLNIAVAGMPVKPREAR